MGTDFCVCNYINKSESESNIFSGFFTKKIIKEEESKTISTDNQLNINSIYKTNQEESNTSNYYLNTGTNDLEKILNNTKNDNNLSQKNKLLSDLKKNDNFIYSGKFNVNISTQKIKEEPNENMEKNSSNLNENNNLIINKNNDVGLISFKSFCDNNTLKRIKTNKESNLVSSKELNNKNTYDINIMKDGKENKLISSQNSNLRLSKNNISRYSDGDFLNNESNYTNSNQREENRNNQSSLFEEDSLN